MNPATKTTNFVGMLNAFIEGGNSFRSTLFVRSIESEFARLGFDDDDALSDLQHALAMYRGNEEDIETLKSEAIFTIKRLSTQ